MKPTTAYLAIVLGVIGLVACMAGLIALWVARPRVLESSAEILAAADDGLKLVEERATHVDELVSKIQSSLDPVSSKILKLADKSAPTPEDEKELKVSAEDLSERLQQVGPIVETAESAVAFLHKSSRLTRSVQQSGFRIPNGKALAEDAEESSQPLSRMAVNLKQLHEKLAMVSGSKQGQKEIVANLVQATRDVDENLKSVTSLLQRVREKAVALGTDVEKLHTKVPAWTNWTAVIGSLVLTWMGLGQFVLFRKGWDAIHPNRTA
jgi:chromosome segregation ATPase